jgi:hypothetical protein
VTKHYGEDEVKAEAIKALVREDPSLAKREIARRVGTSHSQVSRVMAEDEAPEPMPVEATPVTVPTDDDDEWRRSIEHRLSELALDIASLRDMDDHLLGSSAANTRMLGDLGAYVRAQESKREVKEYGGG